MSRIRNRVFFGSDVVLLVVAAYASYVMRLERFDLRLHWSGFVLFSAISIAVIPTIFWYVGIYARYWRYASVEELMLLAGAVTTGTFISGGASFLLLWVVHSSLPMPRSIPFIFLFLALAVTACPRFAVRLAARQRGRVKDARGARPNGSGRVLVIGAGDVGAMIVREMRSNPGLGLDVVGFVDDDPSKQQVRIHGIPVLGEIRLLRDLVESFKIDQVIIAIKNAHGKTIRGIMDVCDSAGVRARIIPGMSEILGEDVSIRHLREVRIEDLLRREPVQIDVAGVTDLLKGRRVLVTGGGGSIGSELCRQIAQRAPAELILLGHGENSVFQILTELQKTHPELRVTPVIADIRFPDRILGVCEMYRPEIVFHAAAHKHVPLMESNVEDAVTNNVYGTNCLVSACVDTGVEHFVLISTDKAVNPSSVMGATKRVAELIVQDAARQSGRAFVAVRFGNVLGSRGSVVPFFQQQIASGGPVTVTHPDVKRYFMTIPEAVQLVLQAATQGQGGEIFVLDMGEPVRISDLAADLIRLSGMEPGRDIEIQYVGMRPGEKLEERLFSDHEDVERTGHEKIFRHRNGLVALPPAVGVEAVPFDRRLSLLIERAWAGDTVGTVIALQAIVPEYERQSAP